MTNANKSKISLELRVGGTLYSCRTELPWVHLQSGLTSEELAKSLADALILELKTAAIHVCQKEITRLMNGNAKSGGN